MNSFPEQTYLGTYRLVRAFMLGETNCVIGEYEDYLKERYLIRFIKYNYSKEIKEKCEKFVEILIMNRFQTELRLLAIILNVIYASSVMKHICHTALKKSL